MAKKPKLSDNWPNVLSGNEVIWSSKESNIDIDIKSVELEKLECSPFSVIRDCSWRVHFSTTGTVFELAGKSITVLQTPQIPEFSWRATKLCQHCDLVDSSGPVVFNQVVREATIASNPDSDDEQLADPAIPKYFSERELIIINYNFAALSESFSLAKNKHLQNHAGKLFFTNLGKFVMSVLPLPPDSYYNNSFHSFHSTNPKGDAQPGACSVIMSYPAVRTRPVKETTNSAMNLVADYVLYDTLRKFCCVVGEVKSEIEDAEQQNVYQMLACFRKDQTVMLGFTANREYIQPRLLLRSGSKLNLYILSKLNLSLSNSISDLARLFVLVGCTTICESSSSSHEGEGRSREGEGGSHEGEGGSREREEEPISS